MMECHQVQLKLKLVQLVTTTSIYNDQTAEVTPNGGEM